MSNARREYFDTIADKWDGWMDMPNINARITEGLDRFGLGPDETVLDVGCGTGNLTRVLLDRLSASGRVVAIDPSARMLALARAKNPDDRADVSQTHARDLDLAGASLDRVICFSVWPHVDAPEETLGVLHRLVRPGGWLHIWHIDSRETINRIHTEAGEAVRGDHLMPAVDLADLVAGAGFDLHEVVDNDTEYVVTARKGAAR